MLGLKRGIVQLVPHQEVWRELFLEERTRLKALLGDGVVEIEHIGSTSISGMTAKPTLDVGVGVGVEDFEEAFALIAPLERIGYNYRGDYGIPRRHSFIRGTAEVRTHHLHMVEVHSENWKKTLFFRDYLRAHPEAAKQYQTLKEELVQKFPDNREAYIECRHAFIQDILSRA